MEKEQLIELVKKSQSGDQSAIEQLLQYAHTSVSYQCRKMLTNEQDAEDMTQEVLVTIYTKLDTLQEPAAFWKWANQITATRCINALNRTHVEYQFTEDEEGHSILDNLEELDEQVIPDKAIDNAETARMIEEIVSSLPDAQRAATLMFYYDEMSVKEIAETMQVSENTVKSRLNYARKAIKEKVLDYEKQGVKLYGLSPLPFLLYFLRLAANLQKDEEAAGIMVAEVMATEGAVAGVAGASTTGAAVAAGGSVATAAGATAATGIFAGISIKVAAVALAAVVTVGGIAAAVIPNTQRDTAEPSSIPTEAISGIETESDEMIFETEIPVTEATVAPTETESAETEPHTHKYTETVTQPTCTDNGYTAYTCSCGDSYKDNETAATGHSMVETERVSYTCDTPGYYAMTCSACGHSETTEIPIHSDYVLGYIQAEGGEGEHGYCKIYSCPNCEYLLVEVLKIEPHNYVRTNDLIPCGTDAYYDYKCSECGYTKREDVDPIYAEHDFVEDDVPDDGYLVCSHCGRRKYFG